MDAAGAGGTRGALGRAGEAAATALYRRRGFSILARNWRCPAGELDLVASRGPLVAFCEVKTRSGRALGGGYEAVTWRKQRKLRQLAELFLVFNRLEPGAIRFDVASVRPSSGSTTSVELFEDAF